MEPLTGALEPYEWDSEESVAYEAAIEAINGAVGAYSALIAREEAKPAADQEAIARWLKAQADCARAREALDPTDHGQIAETRQHYARVAHDLRTNAG